MSLIKLAKISKTVGLKGEIKCYPYGNRHLLYKNQKIVIDGINYSIASLREQKGFPIIKLFNIENIEMAQKLVNREIFADKNELNLEEDEYLVSDVIGFDAISEGKVIAKLEDVDTSSFQDLYIFIDSQNKRHYIPGEGPFIKEIDFENKCIYLELIEGLW